MIEFTRKYANNDQACEEFFLRAKYPNGYCCENVAALTAGRFLHAISNHVYTCSKCCHLSCLFEGTVFQDCKLNLHKLLLVFYLLYFQQRCQRNRDASSAGCKLQDCITAVQKIQNAIQIRCRITCSMKQM